MIYDKTENAKKYIGGNKNLDIALKYICENDLSALPDGKTVIDGENVFVNVMTADTNENNDGMFEYHKDHFDIQLDLNGSEKVLVSFNALPQDEKYTYDIGFVKTNQTGEVTLKPRYFAVCMPNELHKPTMAVNNTQTIRKAVFKIRF